MPLARAGGLVRLDALLAGAGVAFGVTEFASHGTESVGAVFGAVVMVLIAAALIGFRAGEDAATSTDGVTGTSSTWAMDLVSIAVLATPSLLAAGSHAAGLSEIAVLTTCAIASVVMAGGLVVRTSPLARALGATLLVTAAMAAATAVLLAVTGGGWWG